MQATSFDSCKSSNANVGDPQLLLPTPTESPQLSHPTKITQKIGDSYCRRSCDCCKKFWRCGHNGGLPVFGMASLSTAWYFGWRGEPGLIEYGSLTRELYGR